VTLYEAIAGYITKNRLSVAAPTLVPTFVMVRGCMLIRYPLAQVSLQSQFAFCVLTPEEHAQRLDDLGHDANTMALMTRHAFVSYDDAERYARFHGDPPPTQAELIELALSPST
jgi:hypothetical protein